MEGRRCQWQWHGAYVARMRNHSDGQVALLDEETNGPIALILGELLPVGDTREGLMMNRRYGDMSAVNRRLKV